MDKIIVNTTCPNCGNSKGIIVPSMGYELWRAGELIQRAMPSLDIETRERLISGICPECWQILFSGSEEDGDTGNNTEDI